MRDPHAPLRPADKTPDAVEPDIPETDAPELDFPEGQLPGLPLSHDPLLNPGATPGRIEKRPLD